MTTNLDYRDRIEYHFDGEWSKDLPIKKGWYWVNIRYPNFRHAFIIYIDENQTYSSPTEWDDENRESISKFDDAYYCGPIPEPEMIEKL